MIYQSSRLYSNYYVAVINLCLIKNFVLKVHLNIFIKNIWRFLWVSMTFFCGTGDKRVKDVNINFFLDKFHIDALLLWFFSPGQVLLFIEIYVTLLFPNFRWTFYQHCFLFTRHWFYYTISRLSKSLHFLYIYPCR